MSRWFRLVKRRWVDLPVTSDIDIILIKGIFRTRTRPSSTLIEAQNTICSYKYIWRWLSMELSERKGFMLLTKHFRTKTLLLL